MAQRRSLAQLRLAVRDNLDEIQATFWTDDQLNRFLTRAAHQVHTECRTLKADYHLITLDSLGGNVQIFGETYNTDSLAIAAGSTTVTLPPDLLELKLIECITPGLEWVSFDLSVDLSTPDFRAARQAAPAPSSSFLADVVAEQTLVLAPASNQDLDIRITYISSACIYSDTGAILMDFTEDTDTLMMPFPLYHAVEAWATSYAHMMDRNPAMANDYQQQALATIRRAISADARQTQDPVFVQDYDP